MRRLYLLLMLFATPILGFSQKIYKEGFIINNEADTIKGSITIKTWQKNPDFIFFKKSGSNETEKINIDNIKSFSIPGSEEFTRFKVFVSQSASNLSFQPAYLDTTKVEKTVFLRTVIKGDSASLYSFSDDIKKRYYISYSNRVPEELAYFSYLQGGNLNVKRNYIDQLILAAYILNRLTPDIEKKITVVEYEEDALSAIINLINNKSGIQYTSNKKRKTTFFGAVGINRNTLTYTGDHPLAQGKISHNNTYYPSLSIGVDHYINKEVEKFLLRTEFIVGGSKPGTTSTYINVTETSTFKYSFSQITASFQPQALYNFYRSKSLKWQLGAGISINYNYTSNYKYEYESQFSNVSFNKTYNLPPPKLENIYFSGVLRSNVVLKDKLEIGAVYSRPSSMANYASFSIYNPALSLSFGYPLKSKHKSIN